MSKPLPSQTGGITASSLGLCADTCWTLRQRRESIDPASFNMRPEDTTQLPARFLHSLGGDWTYAQSLQQAIDCYTAALRVRTEEAFPQDWAETTANIGLAEWKIAGEWNTNWQGRAGDRETMWKQAEQHLEQALVGFRAIGHAHQVEKHERQLAQLRSERQT